MGLPWNRIFHELNLTPLINKMNELAQTVEQLASQIVTVNNPRITIKQGGETKGSFTLNQSSAKTINLDAGGGGNTNTFSGDYNDLTNKPNIFSGDYNDLTNKPTIPTVNNATLTIKQGGTTKGTFTANASTDVEIDLDAGGGGGSTYTAGAGIDITNNVISVINPIVKTDISFDEAVIPCLFQDTTATPSGALTKEDGTTATLADCLDLGASTLNIGAQFTKYISNVHVSGNGKDYDYGTQAQTVFTYDKDIDSATAQVSPSGNYGLFDETAQIIGGSVSSPSGSYITLQIVLGKANGHLYAFVYNGYFGTLSEQSYISSCTLTADIEFTKI